jgi:hypothetical protein
MNEKKLPRLAVNAVARMCGSAEVPWLLPAGSAIRLAVPDRQQRYDRDQVRQRVERQRKWRRNELHQQAAHTRSGDVRRGLAGRHLAHRIDELATPDQARHVRKPAHVEQRGARPHGEGDDDQRRQRQHIEGGEHRNRTDQHTPDRVRRDHERPPPAPVRPYAEEQSER